jgi:hypothetical protein
MSLMGPMSLTGPINLMGPMSLTGPRGLTPNGIPITERQCIGVRCCSLSFADVRYHLPLYFVSALRERSELMEVDFQAIRTDELKSRIGELRRYL